VVEYQGHGKLRMIILCVDMRTIKLIQYNVQLMTFLLTAESPVSTVVQLLANNSRVWNLQFLLSYSYWQTIHGSGFSSFYYRTSTGKQFMGLESPVSIIVQLLANNSMGLESPVSIIVLLLANNSWV
jgi:hypothetical protein